MKLSTTDLAQAGQEVIIINPVIVMGPGDLNLISGSFLKEVKRFGWLTTVTPSRWLEHAPPIGRVYVPTS